jgi:acyl-[acyl carrier protein]--UDP-N-acetylglucosamine O-acyltransferase
MGKGVKFILGNNGNQDPLTIYEDIQRNLKNLGSAEEQHEYISKYIDKINYEDLKNHNISETDVEDIKKALKEVYETNDKDLKKYRSKILLEVEKLRNNVNR